MEKIYGKTNDNSQWLHPYSLTLYLTIKFLPCSNWKHFADKKLNVTQKFQFVAHRIENIMEKGENAD